MRYEVVGHGFGKCRLHILSCPSSELSKLRLPELSSSVLPLARTEGYKGATSHDDGSLVCSHNQRCRPALQGFLHVGPGLQGTCS